MRLGSDPEVFLINSDGNHVSAIGLVNADKWNPMQIPDMPVGFTLQEDNVSLEYGIPPAATADEFVQHIKAVMNASKPYIGQNLSFSKLSCVVFNEDQMQHPAAHIFGCEPDFNAWTGGVNRKPQPPHEWMRSAGGHIHVETKQDARHVGKMMDLYLGVPSILMDINGSLRKKLYGKAGCIRFKPYGVEYRTLSNFWIFEEKLIRWVWEQTQRALTSQVDVDKYSDLIQKAINDDDAALALDLCTMFSLEVA